jgi:hypothetical protein
MSKPLPAERPRPREAALIRSGSPLLGFQHVCRADCRKNTYPVSVALSAHFRFDGVEATLSVESAIEVGPFPGGHRSGAGGGLVGLLLARPGDHPAGHRIFVRSLVFIIEV